MDAAMTERILESVEARVPRTTREISASTPCNRIRLRTGIARPNFYWPEFSWAAMVELVLPLAITVLAEQNAQGFVVIEAAGHKPPVNAVTTACGIGSLLAAPFGAVSTCLTGPVNAIISSAGERERHYAAGVIVCLFALLFGIFAPAITRFMLALPNVFIATL